MKKFSSLLLTLSICLSCGLISNVAVAKKLSEDELRARSMDQGRTLQSRIRALKKLYSHMLIDGEIPPRMTCVWDVLGKQGPIYTTTIDQALRMRHYGITMNVRAYTDEQEVVDKLKSGECDTSIMSGAQAKQFNDFTGSIEALGGVPSRKHMKYLMQVLASTHAHKKMQQGDYHIVGVIPIGVNYLFTHDGKKPTLKRTFNGKASIVNSDVSQKALFDAFGMRIIQGKSTAAAAGAYNLADADVVMAPLVGYNMFNLGAGLKHGSIVDYPLSQMTLQVVSRVDTIPPEVGQFLREDLFIKLNMMYREVEKNSREVPKEKMIKFSAREEKILDTKIASIRDEVTKEGGYNKGMMKLQKRIRCKIDKQRQECKKK
jgi:Solute-binding protein AdeT 1/2